MSEHSPTPWAEDPDDRDGMEWNIHIVQATDRDMRVCFMTSGPEAAPNAAFIVKAVNAHDDLVAALRSCVDSLNFVAKEITKSETGEFEAWSHPANSIRMAQAILASITP